MDFLSKKRAENDGDVPQYYVENSHPAIIDKDTWEAVQLEMERRRAYAEMHQIQKIDFATARTLSLEESFAEFAGGLMAERFGIQRMKGFEGLSGDVILNIL